jgi:hypothetical protein
MNRFVLALSLCAGLGSSGALADGGKEAGEKPKDVTISGEVLDLTCFMEHGAKGAEHASCAKTCITGGLPVGLLESGTGNVYLVITKDHKAANAALADKAGKMVKITGHVRKGQGVNVLVMAKVE